MKMDIYRPQKLWFTDKHTGEEVVVDTEKIENGEISFSYRGKQYVIPVSMLGNRIYVYLPGKPRKIAKSKIEEPKIEEPLKEIFYQGEYFKLENDRWISDRGIEPKGKYQKRLSDLYQKRYEHYNHLVEELVTFARKQRKDVEGINTAIRTLEIAMLRANAGEARGFLAMLCSLYRQVGASNAAAELYVYSVKKYGKRVETPQFLISAAAAFMDIGNIGMAGELKNKAFAKTGRDDEKLTNFGWRFVAETRLE